MVNNENGFTLIEALIVLSIFIFMYSFSVFSVKPQFYQLENQLFFSQLKADIYYAQQYAISTQRTVSINIQPGLHTYYIAQGSGGYLIERRYSDEITITEGSLSLYFSINSKGNLSKFGSLAVYIGERKYRVTFLIGKGRFYVVREK